MSAATSHAATPSDPSFESELRKLFSAPQHAVAVGVRYLQLNPEKADRRTLMNDLTGPDFSASKSRSSLAHLVSDWQERDFRNGAVVVLDGWVLARAEVSLCALLYLQQGT